MKVNSFISKTFAWMGAGLIITGILSIMVLKLANQNIWLAIKIQQWMWVLFLVLILISIALAKMYEKANTSKLAVLYFLYCALMGIVIGSVMLIYQAETVVLALFATIATFAVVSIWASFTKRDLTSWGIFGYIALIGIIVASLLNFFLYLVSPAIASTISWAITYFGVFVFMALLASDIKHLKKLSVEIEGNKDANVNNLALMGAFGLYLNFINMLLLFLRIAGR